MKKNIIEEGMDIVFLLDRSGSMAGIESDTIGGYNSYINDFKDKNVRVTTILFDGRYESLYKRTPISEVDELTNKEYFVRGSTALLDAIGRTIKYLDKEEAKKVMFVITTDGYENSSRRYNTKQIKEMILGHKDWEFIYVGADIDSFEEGGNIGIKKSNIANYKKDKRGVSTLFNSIKNACCAYYCGEELDESWKEELEEYIDDNKEIF